MCFSAQASFAASAALLPVGLYCLRTALRKDARFVPLALVPLAFGIQQASEGCVWLGVEGNDASLVQPASVLFLFFALAFWPFWMPLSLLIPETRPRERTLLAFLLLLSPVWFWLYYPAAADPQRWLSLAIVGHSIQYQFDDLPGFQIIPRPFWQLSYLVAICLPLALGRFGAGGNRSASLFGGVLVAALFAVSYLVYGHAFTSVWCFFAALLSLLLSYVFFQLPPRLSASRHKAGDAEPLQC